MHQWHIDCALVLVDRPAFASKPWSNVIFIDTVYSAKIVLDITIQFFNQRLARVWSLSSQLIMFAFMTLFLEKHSHKWLFKEGMDGRRGIWTLGRKMEGVDEPTLLASVLIDTLNMHEFHFTDDLLINLVCSQPKHVKLMLIQHKQSRWIRTK